MSETKTPRTDATSRKVEQTTYYMGAVFKGKVEVVDSSFARLLETELNEARAEIERLKEVAYSRGQELTALDNKYHFERETDWELIEKLREALERIAKIPESYKELADTTLSSAHGQGIRLTCDGISKVMSPIIKAALGACEKRGKQ